jgi:hypothetical protein
VLSISVKKSEKFDKLKKLLMIKQNRSSLFFLPTHKKTKKIEMFEKIFLLIDEELKNVNIRWNIGKIT